MSRLEGNYETLGAKQGVGGEKLKSRWWQAKKSWRPLKKSCGQTEKSSETKLITVSGSKSSFALPNSSNAGKTMSVDTSARQKRMEVKGLTNASSSTGNNSLSSSPAIDKAKTDSLPQHHLEHGGDRIAHLEAADVRGMDGVDVHQSLLFRPGADGPFRANEALNGIQGVANGQQQQLRIVLGLHPGVVFAIERKDDLAVLDFIPV